MDGKQLKNSILQWAIQGKLVPQNPKDEPASKLLERIEESRNESSLSLPKGTAKGTKSKDLKKKTSKNQPSRIYCENGVWYEHVGTATPKDITDEIPFEIPETWAWCRIQNISQSYIGLTYRPEEIAGEGTVVLRSSNIKNGKIVLDDIVRVKTAISEKLFVQENDILICARNGSKKLVGKAALIPHMEEKMTFGAFMAICKTPFYAYIYFYLLSDLFYQQLWNVSGTTTINQLTQNNFNHFLVPLPPLAEQKRIVAKLEQVLPLAEEYGAAQEQLDKLNKELPEALKKSILQEAIQGKLVPQNPKDEPASVLLAKIRKEKESLVKQGKLKKKDLEFTPINEEEIPFEIPDTWTWCRLKDIVYNHGQKTPTESFSYIDIGSIDNKRQKLNDKENIIQASDAPSRARKIVKINDILYSTVRPYLHNMCIIDREFSKEPIASTGFAVMACYENVVSKFLFYYLLSPEFDDYANDGDNAKGIAYPAINDEKLYKALIPLPPLAEQKRIVAKLEQLFKVIY